MCVCVSEKLNLYMHTFPTSFQHAISLCIVTNFCCATHIPVYTLNAFIMWHPPIALINKTVNDSTCVCEHVCQFSELKPICHQWIWNMINTGGCHSHRFYSRSCDRRSNFDQLFSPFWPLTTLIFGLWPLTALNFNRWTLTTHTFTEECVATPPLP